MQPNKICYVAEKKEIDKMNNKIKEQIKKDLEKVQSKCTANLMDYESVVKYLEEAERHVKELIKFDSKFYKACEFEYFRGDQKRGWHYITTVVIANFKSNGEVKNVDIFRSKASSYQLRVKFNDSRLNKKLTILEKKLLKKYFGLNQYATKNL